MRTRCILAVWLASAAFLVLSSCCAAETRLNGHSSENIERREVYRRFLKAASDRLEYGWRAIVSVGMSETSERRIEQYDQAAKDGPNPFPLVFGDYLTDIPAASNEPRIRTYSSLQDLKALVTERASIGKKTYGLMLFSIGDDNDGPSYVSFGVFEARVDPVTGEVGQYGDFANFGCIVYGTEKAGWELSLISMAVS